MTDKIKEWDQYFSIHCQLPAAAIIDLFAEIEALRANDKIRAASICEYEGRIEQLEKWIREISEHTPHAWLKEDAKEILEGE